MNILWDRNEDNDEDNDDVMMIRPKQHTAIYLEKMTNKTDFPQNREQRKFSEINNDV